jgi:hypothetical protein
LREFDDPIPVSKGKPPQKHAKADKSVAANGDFRSTSDTVAKVENRATLKISRKLIFGAFQPQHRSSAPIGRLVVDF